MKVSSLIRAALTAALVVATLHAQVKQHPIPRLVEKDGRYALMVDDAPYLVLARRQETPARGRRGCRCCGRRWSMTM